MYINPYRCILHGRAGISAAILPLNFLRTTVPLLGQLTDLFSIPKESTSFIGVLVSYLIIYGLIKLGLYILSLVFPHSLLMLRSIIKWSNRLHKFIEFIIMRLLIIPARINQFLSRQSGTGPNSFYNDPKLAAHVSFSKMITIIFAPLYGGAFLIKYEMIFFDRLVLEYTNSIFIKALLFIFKYAIFLTILLAIIPTADDIRLLTGAAYLKPNVFKRQIIFITIALGVYFSGYNPLSDSIQGNLPEIYGISEFIQIVLLYIPLEIIWAILGSIVNTISHRKSIKKYGKGYFKISRFYADYYSKKAFESNR